MRLQSEGVLHGTGVEDINAGAAEDGAVLGQTDSVYLLIQIG